MKKLITILFALALVAGIITQNANAATYTVGSGGTYATLKAAFDDINAGTITGAITLQIIGNTTETASAVLNASGSGSASYTSVNIYPTVTGLTISGDLALPLIDLNGATNVTIDGRVNGTGATKDLTIVNASTSSVTSTSTIRFINDATDNMVKYCTVKGSALATISGIIFFYTATSAGNNNNTIDNNDITNANGNRPYRAIRSTGTAGKPNSNNTISNNNIYDFWNASTSGMAVFCATNTTAWTLTGNSIYETTTVVSTDIQTFVGLQLNGTHTATGNYIGGSAPLCGGTAFTKLNGSSNSFSGIQFGDGTIQNNTIKNIAWSNPSSADFNGISRSGSGNSDISSNTVGTSTGTGSITVTNATDASVYGIRNSGAGTINIQNNNIGSVTTLNSDATKKTNFYGIYNLTGTPTVSNNIIGSTTTANSINSSSASTTSAQRVYGIYSSTPTTINANTIANIANGTTNGTAGTSGFISGIYSTSTATITDNIIRDLTIANANTAPDSTASVSGIALRGVFTKTVTGNTIYNLSNTYPSFAGNVTGLYFEGNTGSNAVSNNFIHSLSATAANGAGIYGIKITSGATTYSNNIISLGGNTTANIYGIYETGAASNNNNLYFNSVYIGGAPTTGALNSYALYSGASTNSRNFRNNIFYNARSNSGASGKYYAAAIASGGTITIDYNDYYVSGSGGVIGNFGGTDETTLADWKTATGQDVHSLNTNPGFASAGGTTAINYFPSVVLPGVAGTGITTDYAGTTRSFYTMGAYEFVPPVHVAATSGASSGDYTTLKAAFDKINDGTHQGTITITLLGNTTETTSAVLNASGSGSASYTSVNIYPTVTGLTISGNLALPLIDLNGATNVTIDGRVNGTGATKDLTITNTSTSAVAPTSTIRFVYSAERNTVKYCTVKGASTDGSAGIIFFSTSASGNGNSDNTITNCNLTNDGGNRPVNVIYSSGSSAHENSNNTISNNNIYDFLNNTSINSTGIYISGYSTGWNITGNSLYETATADNSGIMINIDNASGNNFTISGNYIGGSAPLCGGSPMTINSVVVSTFGGISLNVGTSIASNIQGNTIKNINITCIPAEPFFGIFVGAGAVNIGTTTGNKIGATTGNGSITITNTSTDATSCGIYVGAANIVDIQNNNIGSITTVGSASYSHSFYGILSFGGAGTTTVSNNTIGSTATPNSIQASSSSQSTTPQDVYGILSGCSGTVNISVNTIANMYNAYAYTSATDGKIAGIWVVDGSNTITNNTIYNLSTTSPSSQIAILGILQGSNADGQIVSGNTIHDLSDTYSGGDNISILGLYVSGTGSLNLVENNFIYGLSLSSIPSSSVICGIGAGAGATTYANNIITIGGGISADYNIFGIYQDAATGNNNNLYFNTVYIAGSATSGGNNSYALLSGASTNTRNFRNNIFYNARSNSGAISKHYAISLPGSTNLTIDYNDYYASGTGGVIGNFGGTDKTTLADWKAATGQDVHSLNTNPGFANAGGTLPYNYIPSITLTGVSGTGITTDYYGTTRADPPTMGALEAPPLVVHVAATSGVSSGDYTTLKVAFDRINDGTHQGNITITLLGNTTETTSAVLNASGSGSASYTSVNIYPTGTGYTIRGSLAGLPLLDLNGATNVTIDGRVNGTGATKDLTITNTSTSASPGTSTIRFIESAESNTVKYCTVKGAEMYSSAGVIFFSTSASGNGNSNNTITNCNLTNDGGNRPVSVIYSSGTSAHENSNNTISNNNFYDFINFTSSNSSGIYISDYSTEWNITGNSLYETTTADNSRVMIYIDNVSGNDFTLSGNYIGGSAPLCGGSPMTINSIVVSTFEGIALNVGTSIASNVQGNTIKNINITSIASEPFVGIFVGAGAVNIGTTADNTIGEATGTGSITVTNTTNDAVSIGINNNSTGTLRIQNNTLGSITTVGSASYSHSFYGILKAGGADTTTISNNTIGSTATPNSIQASSSSQSTAAQDVYGIVTMGSGTVTISGNTISNMYNAYANTSATDGKIGGIWIYNGSCTITNNTIYNLSTTSPSTVIAIVGIIQGSSSDGQIVSGNTIHDLSDTYSGSNGISVVGLCYGGTGSLNLIENNFIYGLSLSASSPSSVICGIAARAGSSTYANNIINIGNGISVDYNIFGILENGVASNYNNLYFNTVYIGGSATSGDYPSYAFISGANTITKNFRNNIFYNARSNGGTAIGNHYAISLSGSTNLTIDYNDYYVSGIGSVLGNFGGAGEPSLAAWQGATGQDVHSLNTNPGFANAGGTLPYNYIPSVTLTGVAGTGITTDYYGTTREDPPTMGAWDEILAFIWTGATSTDWSDSSNWSSNTVPMSDNDVIISSVPSNQPHVTASISSPATCKNITLNTGASLTIDPGKALTINGNITYK